jgi:hypothetical protein
VKKPFISAAIFVFSALPLLSEASTGGCRALSEFAADRQIPALSPPKISQKKQKVTPTDPKQAEVFVLFEVAKSPSKNTLTVYHRGKQLIRETLPGQAAAKALADKEGIFRPFALEEEFYSRRSGTQVKNIIAIDRNWVLAHETDEKGFGFGAEECSLLPAKLSEALYQAVKNSGLKLISLMDRDGLPLRTDDGKSAQVWGYDTLVEVRVSKDLKKAAPTLTKGPSKTKSTLLE